MIRHPRLALQFIPFSETEILLKRQNDILLEKKDMQTFYASLSSVHRSILSSSDLRSEPDPKSEWTICLERQLRYLPAKNHTHSFFELLYCMSGNGTVIWENNSIDLIDGDFLFLPPNSIHSVCLDNASILISIYINPSFFIQTFSRFLTEKHLLAFFFLQGIYQSKLKNYLKCSAGNNSNIAETMEKLILEHFLRERYSELLRDSFFSSVLNYLIRDFSDKMTTGISRINDDSVIPKIRLYLQDHLTDATLKNLAEYFSYSPPYLSRMIRQKTGQSFLEMLRGMKLERACSLLNGTNLSVSDISGIVGYENQRQFNRIFLENIGCTPSQYRTKKTGTYYCSTN